MNYNNKYNYRNQHQHPNFAYHPYPYLVNGSTPVYFSNEYFVDQNGEHIPGGFIQTATPTAFIRPALNLIKECACPIGCQQLNRQIVLKPCFWRETSRFFSDYFLNFSKAGFINENDFLALECTNPGCQTNSKNIKMVNLVHRACVQVQQHV